MGEEWRWSARWSETVIERAEYERHYASGHPKKVNLPCFQKKHHYNGGSDRSNRPGRDKVVAAWIHHSLAKNVNGDHRGVISDLPNLQSVNSDLRQFRDKKDVCTK